MLRLSALVLSLSFATSAFAAPTESHARFAANGLSAGAFSYAAPEVYSSQGSHPRSLAFVDVNGDGIKDALVLNGCNVGDTCTSAKISVRLGRADGTFGESSLYDTNAYTSYALSVADLNGDGHADIVVSDSCVTPACTDPGTLSVLYGNGDGSFQPAILAGSGGDEPFALAIADVNADGKPDLLVINYCQGSCGANSGNAAGELTVLLGNGDGSFQTPISYSAGGSSPQGFVLADVNKDGILDAVISNCGLVSDCSVGGVAVLLGNADGTFRSAVSYVSGGASSGAVKVADLNGDGNPDLAVLHPCTDRYSDCSQSVIGILFGAGNGTFSLPVTIRTSARIASALEIADVDGDHVPDIIVGAACDASSETCSSGVVSVLLANGSGTFRSPVIFAEGGNYPRDLAVAELNSDGQLDLIALNECDPSANGCAFGNLAVLMNDSVPTGTALSFTTVSSSGQQSAFGELVTFTAAVAAGGPGVPSGSVGFSADGVFLQYVPLDHGVAAFTTSTLSVARHTLTARYLGDATFAPSSGEVEQLVQGGIPSLSTSTLEFGTQPVGSSSISLTATVTNAGTLPLVISSIAVAPGSAGFSATNNCPASLPVGAACNISVKFRPTTVGSSNATLLIEDNAVDPEQSIALHGTTDFGTSPTSISFPAQYVSSKSRAQRLTITNTGTTTVPLNAPAASASDFVLQSGCGGSLAPGATCWLDVSFQPTTSGNRSGVITVSSAASSSQTIPVDGVGNDFAFTADGPSTSTVTPGKAASFGWSIRPSGLSGTVAFSCTGAPSRATCAVVPGSLSLDGTTPEPIVMTVTTAGASAGLAWPHLASFACVLMFCGFPGMLLLPVRGARRLHLLSLFLLMLLIVTCSCGGGSAATATVPAGGNTGGTGTPSGTYQITVTGTFTDGSTTLTHNALVTLVVN